MKRTRLKRQRGFRRTEYQMASQFRFAVMMRDELHCLCEDGTCKGPIDAHHVIPKQSLIKHGHDETLWDLRNGVTLCRRHHDAHHRGKRIPLVQLPEEAFEFAAEMGLDWLLAKMYVDSGLPLRPLRPLRRGGGLD